MHDMSFAHLENRAVIRLYGEDTRRFLQGLITQDVNAIDKAPLLFSAMLTPQGKFAYDFFLHRGEEGTLFVDMHAENAEPFITTLKRYKLRSKVTIERTDDAVAAAWNESPPPEKGWLPDPRHPKLGWRKIAAGTAKETNASYDAHRLALAIPDGALDADDRCFLLELGYDQLHGVSFSKGCFIGQEPTARMHYRKVLRKGFFAVQSAQGDALPPAGTPITAGEASIGEMRSCSGALGLAFCRMEPWQKATANHTPILAGEIPVHLSIPDYMQAKWDAVLHEEKNAL